MLLKIMFICIAILFVLHIFQPLLKQSYFGAVARIITAEFQLMWATITSNNLDCVDLLHSGTPSKRFKEWLPGEHQYVVVYVHLFGACSFLRDLLLGGELI